MYTHKKKFFGSEITKISKGNLPPPREISYDIKYQAPPKVITYMYSPYVSILPFIFSRPLSFHLHVFIYVFTYFGGKHHHEGEI